MSIQIPRSPLKWPAGWKRTPAYQQTRANFGKTVFRKTGTREDGSAQGYQAKTQLTIGEAVKRIQRELERMGVDDNDVAITTNLELRLDGLPRSGQRAPRDPGVAVYWLDRRDRQTPKCMAVDRYNRIEDNLAAVAATLEAMRAIERHGGAEILTRAFVGFAALPGPDALDWRQELEYSPTEEPRPAEITERWRALRSRYHPDKQGGDAARFGRINRAYEQAIAERGT